MKSDGLKKKKNRKNYSTGFKMKRSAKKRPAWDQPPFLIKMSKVKRFLLRKKVLCCPNSLRFILWLLESIF
jgi:hypothetical protein